MNRGIRQKNWFASYMKKLALDGATPEQKALFMFNRLKDNIGNKVICEYWINGVKCIASYQLLNVTYFDHAELRGLEYGEITFMPFIGEKAAVVSIRSAETSEVLFDNPDVKVEYTATTNDDIDSYKRRIYGDSVVNKQNLRAMKKMLINAQETSVETENDELKKEDLIKGAEFVREDTKKLWIQFVTNNTADSFNIYLAEIILFGIRSLKLGAQLESVIQFCCDKLPDDQILNIVLGSIAFYSDRGNELIDYWLERPTILSRNKPDNN